jgi:DNA-binding transcriptional LysR family regulator
MRSGSVKIGCAFGAMPEIAGDLIFAFQQEYPQFRPDVLREHRPDVRPGRGK